MKGFLNSVRSRWAILAHDLTMVPLAWIGAYLLRFNLDEIPEPIFQQALSAFPIVLIMQGAMFWYFGLYRGVWRFASLPDLIRIVKAVIAGVCLSALVIFLWTRLHGVPRTVFVLDGILLMFLLGGPRFIYRWVRDRHLYVRTGKKTLIVGAGQAGEMLVRDLLRNANSLYSPIAFVDDHPRTQLKDIHGIPVVGSCADIPQVVNTLEVELILIALPSATSKEMQRIVGICESTEKPFRILPRTQDLVSGQISVKELRDVKIDDLLGRETVALDWQSITEGIQGKSVLVSGGGGSIGSELCRQIAKLNPARLIILEQSEFNLYAIDMELRRDCPTLSLICELVDVQDKVAVDQAFARYRPQVVFHAAAYKHVPMLESQVRAAVVNNVFGTLTLARAADQYRCESFVLISTDKAVNPSNVMGATKRVAEIICQNFNEDSRTRFITVRFGNVLGSAGSVIPLFQKQIAAGGPVTVTHPEITRYFMTIPEAAQLILQAGVLGQGGEIFVLDMGEPVNIAYLAKQLILLSGKKPDENIEIVYTGLRPGEKLYEELFHDAEKLTETVHPKILRATSRRVDRHSLDRALEELVRASEGGDEDLLKKSLRRLVPEHHAGAAPADATVPLAQQKR